MIYLGDKPIGLSTISSINWDRVAIGDNEFNVHVTLSDAVTSIIDRAFFGLSILSLKGDNVSSIGNRSLASTSQLANVDCKNVTHVGGYCFNSTPKLHYLVMPNLIQIDGDAFYQSGLLGLDIGNKNITEGFIGTQYSFEQPPACITIFRYGYMLPAKTGWFYNNTWLKNASTPGTLYVWENLIPYYQADAVWGPLLESNNNQILPIEGSVYETQYIDGTSIST